MCETGIPKKEASLEDILRIFQEDFALEKAKKRNSPTSSEDILRICQEDFAQEEAKKKKFIYFIRELPLNQRRVR